MACLGLVWLESKGALRVLRVLGVLRALRVLGFRVLRVLRVLGVLGSINFTVPPVSDLGFLLGCGVLGFRI